jgi:glycosyltransferase involved in cell wall biosynthesis
MQDAIVKNGKQIVFSSKSAKKDFNQIHPQNTLRQFVLRFAVTHPALENCNSVLARYQLPEDYFICCNQFWQHKNHAIIFKAIHLLKKQGREVLVVFTGKEDDYRHPGYFKELTVLIDQLDIRSNIRLLGFISREDQLCLMKHSIAVLQPSLFEGWSTVIEDAKSLQARIIASAIPVHKEQLEQYSSSALFPSADEQALSALMLSTKEIPAATLDYEKSINEFAGGFRKILETVSPHSS